MIAMFLAFSTIGTLDYAGLNTAAVDGTMSRPSPPGS